MAKQNQLPSRLPGLLGQPRYLRVIPSFTQGVGNALNVFGSFAPMYYGRDPIEADREALLSDWQMVGRDMRSVMRQFELIHRKELEAHGTPLHIVKCED